VSRRGLTRIEGAQKSPEILVYDMEWYPALVSPDWVDENGRPLARKLGTMIEGKERGLRLIGLYDGERQRFFEGASTAEMLDKFFDEVLTVKNAEKWIYAHYGGMADMQFILRRIVEIAEKGGDYQVSASFSGSSAIIVKVTRGNHTWTFIDSFWLLRDKLARLGDSVGIKKLTDSYVCPTFPACGHMDPLTEATRPRGNGRCQHWTDHLWEEKHDVESCGYCGEVKPRSMCVYFAPMPILKTYNEQDCLILYRAIKQFEEVLLGLGGELQMTIASCAMRLFRRVYLGEDIRNKGMGMAEVNAIARSAYTSSRVEVFQRNCPSPQYMQSLEKKGLHQCERRCFECWKSMRFPHAEDFPFDPSKRYEGYEGPILCPKCMLYAMSAQAHYYDLNSSFPYAGTFPMPGNVKRRLQKRLPKNRDAIYLADCEITVPPMYLPPVPYRHKGRVFFPHGTWRAWFSSVDLDLLEDMGGTINKVFESIEFHPQSHLRNYMLDIYERRKNATSKYEKLILKYLLNSLYGKFGERPEKKSMLLYPTNTGCSHDPKHTCEEYPLCEHVASGTDCAACMEMLWPGCYLVTSEGDVAHEWVPIGVHLTAIARKNLYVHLEAAQEDIYYADSIAADRTVVLRDPRGQICIEPVEKVWERLSNAYDTRSVFIARGKEFVRPELGWHALAMDAHGVEGWFPLELLLRHRVAKPMWNLHTEHGETEITCDHGVMLDPLTSATPAEFVRMDSDFVTVKAPPSPRTEETDDASLDEAVCVAENLKTFPKTAYASGLPSFMFELSRREVGKIVEYVFPGGRCRFYTQAVAAGFSYILNQFDIEHSIDSDQEGEYGEEVRFWTLSLDPGDGWRGYAWRDAKPGREEYVYDLSVEGAHTFVDGMGRVLLHNTDSCITTHELPSDPKTLGALKLEENIWDGEFVAPKVYSAKVAFSDEKDRIGEDIVKAKGFSRMTFEKFKQIVHGESVQIARMTRLLELYRNAGRAGALPDATEPEERILSKKMVQKQIPKRCLLDDGQTRPWAIHEIVSDRKDSSISIPPGVGGRLRIR
jgi:hypothetical protein